MKKIVFLFIFLMSAFTANAQLWGFSFGYSYSFNNVKDFKHNLEFGAHISNVYLSWGSNFKYVGENRYGVEEFLMIIVTKHSC